MKIKIKFIILIFLFICSFIITINILDNNNVDNNILKYIIEDNNPYLKKKKNISYYLVKSVIKLDRSTNNLFKGIKMETNASDNNNPNQNSIYIDDPYPNKVIENPTIYIYNTHQLEEYKDDTITEFNITPNVMMTSYILREKLYNLGLKAIVEDANLTEIRNKNKWNYADSYKVSRIFMEEALLKNPSLEYFIDIHRDSVSKNISTVNINNKNYAKVLFIIGLENKNYQQNLDLTNKINTTINNKYSGISRGIYKKSGQGVNGIYNQDFNKNTILIEVGGQENNINEVLNTVIAISETLKEIVEDNNEKN